MVAALLAVSLGCGQAASPLSVTLYVRNPGPARSAWPITSGVPIGRDATYDGVQPIKSTSNLRLYAADGTTPIDAQFRVVSRWDGAPDDATKPIRWVLVDFQADLVGGGITSFVLKGVTAGGTTGGSVTVDDTPTGYIEVNTGALAFRVSKTGFNMFDYVKRTADSAPLVTSSPSNGVLIRTQSTPDTNSTVNPTGSYQAVVEERGPWRTVVRVRGFYKVCPYTQSSYYLGYTVRIYAYSGKDWVRVTYTLENSGQPWYDSSNKATDVFFIDKLHAILNLDGLGNTRTATFQGYSDTFSGSEKYKFEQTHTLVAPADESQNFAYASYKDGGTGYAKAGTGGKRAVGWADLSDSTHGLTVAMRWFWQNYPKAFYISGKQLQVGLFPEGLGSDDGVDGMMTTSGHVAGQRYRFLGCYWKTYDMLYWFHGSDVSGRDALVAAFQSPLLAVPSSSYIDATRALPGHGRLVGRGDWTPTGGDSSANTSDPQRVRYDLREALDRYEDFLRGRWDYTKTASPGGQYSGDDGRYQLYSPDDPSHGLAERRASNGWGQVDWYGWEDYGDTTWLDHHNHLGYDWTYSTLVQFLRTGDVAWWNLAQPMAIHNTDIDLVHCFKWTRVPQLWYVKNADVWVERWEYDAHDKNWDGLTAGKFSHTWNKGRVLYYLLTGEEMYAECANALAQAQADWVTNPNRLPSLNSTARETRWQGWCIESMVADYAITGDANLLATAVRAAVGGTGTNSILQQEHVTAPDGVTMGLRKDYPTGTGHGHTYNTENGGVAGVHTDPYYCEPLIDLYCNLPPGTDRDNLKAYMLRLANYFRDGYGGYGGDMDGTMYRPLRGAYGWPEGGTSSGYTQNLWLCCDELAWAYEQTKDISYLQKAEKVFRDGVFWWEFRNAYAGDSDSVDPSSRSTLYLSWTTQQGKEPAKFQRSFLYFFGVEKDLSPQPAPSGPPSITLSISGDRTSAARGDVVTYTVTYRNAGQSTAANTILSITLPAFAGYLSGSAMLNGSPVAGAAVVGSVLQIPVGDVAAGAGGTVTFQVRMQ